MTERHVLAKEDGRLVLRDLEDPKALPLTVDFLSPTLLHRVKHGLSRGQPLARALGLRGGLNPSVLDATAGLGIDAFIMAAYGCRVRAIERSPVVAELLADGYQRLLAGPENILPAASRLSFELGNAIDVLRALAPGNAEGERPDVVYLDPMYPGEGRSKSALPKKGMQVFRRLLGEDADIPELFTAALTVARERVVVKRPLYAAALTPSAGSRAAQVAHSFEGKTARFDMYLCR